MTIEEYYTAPSQEIFDDIKENAIKIWSAYDNTYGYVDGKVNFLNSLGNIQDNAWAIVNMFDPGNKKKLLKMVKGETALAIINACYTI